MVALSGFLGFVNRDIYKNDSFTTHRVQVVGKQTLIP